VCCLTAEVASGQNPAISAQGPPQGHGFYDGLRGNRLQPERASCWFLLAEGHLPRPIFIIAILRRIRALPWPDEAMAKEKGTVDCPMNWAETRPS